MYRVDRVLLEETSDEAERPLTELLWASLAFTHIRCWAETVTKS